MPGVNRVLYNLDQRGETTPEERTTARRNIDAISADEVAVLFDDHYKVKQSPINMTFAANAVLRRLWQNPNGEIGAECNYIYDATQSTSGFMSPADKTKLDGIAYGAEVNVQSDWNTVDDSLDSFIRNKPDLSIFATRTELDGRLQGKQDKLTAGNNIVIDANNVISATADPQVQADWAQNDSEAVDYIKNKPANLVQDADYHHTDNNFTDADKNKLGGIEAGAEANVQADWAQTDTSADDYIKNKPANLVQDPDYVHTDNNFTDGDKSKLGGIESGAEANVQSDWNEADTSADDYIKNKPDLSVYATKTEVAEDLADKQDKLTAGSNITIVNNVISATAEPQVQADWAQTDSSAVDYIKNKPSNLVQDADYHHTDNNFTDSDKNKLSGVEAGAEANVQADWAESDSSKDSFIKNKPASKPLVAGTNISIVESASQVTISASASPQVQADWNESDSSAVDYIKNKPDLSVYATKTELTTGLAGKQDTISDLSDIRSGASAGATAVQPADMASALATKQDTLTAGSNISIVNNVISATAAPQEQADWNESDSSAVDYIKNKPDIPLLKWEQTTQGATNTYTSDHLTIHQDTHEVRMENAAHTGDVDLGFVVPPVSSAPSENMVLGMASGNTVPTWTPAPGVVPPLKDLVAGNGISITPGESIVTIASNINAGNGIVVTPAAGGNTVAWEYSVGRNLHVNQNNAIQTNLPGGIYNAPTAMSNSFSALPGADFAGAFRLGCRYTTSGTYELALIYTASGLSTTITFIGTETVIGTDNSVTTHAAAYIGENAYYTPTQRFGGTAATPFNPNSHKAIIYDGIAQIGPTSDCKIAIWSDNGTVKVSFVAIEVGKVGSTN